MRKADLEKSIEDLEALREIAARQDYNTSVAINQKLVKIIPLLQNELTKMNRDNYDITSPMIAEITQKDCEDTHQSMQDFMNNYMAELVDNDLTIIDFGINYIDSNTKIGYIKYNRR